MLEIFCHAPAKSSHLRVKQTLSDEAYEHNPHEFALARIHGHFHWAASHTRAGAQNVRSASRTNAPACFTRHAWYQMKLIQMRSSNSITEQNVLPSSHSILASSHIDSSMPSKYIWRMRIDSAPGSSAISGRLGTGQLRTVDGRKRTSCKVSCFIFHGLGSIWETFLFFKSWCNMTWKKAESTNQAWHWDFQHAQAMLQCTNQIKCTKFKQQRGDPSVFFPPPAINQIAWVQMLYIAWSDFRFRVRLSQIKAGEANSNLIFTSFWSMHFFYGVFFWLMHLWSIFLKPSSIERSAASILDPVCVEQVHTDKGPHQMEWWSRPGRMRSSNLKRWRKYFESTSDESSRLNVRHFQGRQMLVHIVVAMLTLLFFEVTLSTVSKVLHHELQRSAALSFRSLDFPPSTSLRIGYPQRLSMVRSTATQQDLTANTGVDTSQHESIADLVTLHPRLSSYTIGKSHDADGPMQSCSSLSGEIGKR